MMKRSAGRTLSLLGWLVLVTGSPRVANAQSPADDAHDKLALALALQKQCGGLSLWEEIFLSSAVYRTWSGSRASAAASANVGSIKSLIERDRPKYAERAKAMGCDGGIAIRQEVHNTVVVDALSLLWLSYQLSQLPTTHKAHRLATAHEVELASALRDQLTRQFASQADQLLQAVDRNTKQMLASDPSGVELTQSLNQLLASLALQNAANKGNVTIRLPLASEVDASFEAVEQATGKVWRAPDLPSVNDEGSVHNRERPYGLLLFGPDGNLAHILIDRVVPQPLPRAFVAAMDRGFAKGDFAHGQPMTAGCPWLACYAYSKSDTERLLAADVHWFEVYLASAAGDGKNQYFVNGSRSALNAIRQRR